jgi:hypothetical protein
MVLDCCGWQTYNRFEVVGTTHTDLIRRVSLLQAKVMEVPERIGIALAIQALSASTAE